MSDETVEPFREKVLRMFFPSASHKKGRKPEDLETIDPLERFEKAIKKDAEDGLLRRKKHSGSN